jgi:hypothetical protein
MVYPARFARITPREVKLNVAAIMREDALYKKKQQEEAKMVEKFETELRDDSEFTRWQTSMKAKVGLIHENTSTLSPTP